MKNFKVECAGLDTSTLEYTPTIEALGEFDFIYSDLSANNDYLYGELISPDSKVIVYSDFSDSVNILLGCHLKTLGRKRADLFLMKEGFVISENHKDIKDEHLTEAWGIQGSDLEKIKITYESMKKEEILPGYLATTLSPFDFDPDLLKWAEENQLEVIGLNPMGGWLSAARNISAFSVPYLLGFAATYCKIVILSGRDIIKSIKSVDYLDQLVGKEGSSMYSLKKTVHRGIKPLKVAINTKVSMADGMITVPYVNPELLMSPEDHILTLNVPQITKKEETEEEEDIILKTEFKTYEATGNFVDDVNGFIGILHFPSDAPESVKFALARYKASEYIQVYHKDRALEITSIGPAVFMFTSTRSVSVSGSLWWKKITPEDIKEYYLINKGNGDFEFVETLPEKPEDLKIDSKLN